MASFNPLVGLLTSGLMPGGSKNPMGPMMGLMGGLGGGKLPMGGGMLGQMMGGDPLSMLMNPMGWQMLGMKNPLSALMGGGGGGMGRGAPKGGAAFANPLAMLGGMGRPGAGGFGGAMGAGAGRGAMNPMQLAALMQMMGGMR